MTSLYIRSVIREITFSSSELKRHIGLVTCSIFNFMVYSILNYYWYMYSSFLFNSFITNNIDLLNAIWWRCILLLLLFFELIPFFTLVVMGGGTWSFLEGTKGKHCFFGYQLVSLSHSFFYNITRTVKQYFLHMHPRILDHTHSVLHHSIFWFWGHSNALCHNVPNIQTHFRNLPVLDKDWSFPLRIWFAFAHNPQRQEKIMQWAW